MSDAEPYLPDYADRCVTNLMPALLAPGGPQPSWLPVEVSDARQIVVFVIDGLGWNQLQARPEVAPTLASLDGGPITTVAPTTTASALTSITTGTPPGEHGVIGYRIAVDGEVLNVLRWSTGSGDARLRIPADQFQPIDPFLGQPAAVISRSEFAQSGFTQAHLSGGEYVGYRTTASMIYEVQTRLEAGERLVYAYYDGLDRIGHEYGHRGHYDAELAYIDAMVAQLIESLPAGTALVVTADHGQVETGDNMIAFDPEVVELTSSMSGEARFRWLHCRREVAGELESAVRRHHGDDAWVLSVDRVIDEGWLGRHVTSAARDRLGEVAVVAKGVVGFLDPSDGGHQLIARHGSLTADEMLVPLLTTVR